MAGSQGLLALTRPCHGRCAAALQGRSGAVLNAESSTIAAQPPEAILLGQGRPALHAASLAFEHPVRPPHPPFVVVLLLMVLGELHCLVPLLLLCLGVLGCGQMSWQTLAVPTACCICSFARPAAASAHTGAVLRSSTLLQITKDMMTFQSPMPADMQVTRHNAKLFGCESWFSRPSVGPCPSAFSLLLLLSLTSHSGPRLLLLLPLLLLLLLLTLPERRRC